MRKVGSDSGIASSQRFPRSPGLVPGGSPLDMEPSIRKLIDDYGLPEVSEAKELFAIIGNPIFHSLFTTFV